MTNTTHERWAAFAAGAECDIGAAAAGLPRGTEE